MNNSNRSTFLFKTPGFIDGAGSIFDFRGVTIQYHTCSNGETADALALHQDWHAVGEDLHAALSNYEAPHKAHR